MAVTIDPRPTYFGDRMIVTGTFAQADTSIDLSGLLSSIDAFILNSTAAPATFNVRNAADDDNQALSFTPLGHVDGTTITIIGGNGGSGASSNGTFLAIGRRS